MTKKKQPKAMFSPASPKQEMMFQRFMDTQIMVIGGAAGSGKSYIMQLLPLMLMDDPNTACVMFRRTTPQLTGQGGLWDTAKGIYQEFPEQFRPKVREKDHIMTFPHTDAKTGKNTVNGGTIKYSHMQHVDDKYNWQGLQLTGVFFDEGKH